MSLDTTTTAAVNAPTHPWSIERKPAVIDTLDAYVQAAKTSEQAVAELAGRDLAEVGFQLEDGPTVASIDGHPAQSPHPASCRSSPTWRALSTNCIDAPTMALNAHLDIVPIFDNQAEGYQSEVDRFYGRGTCDTLGNLAMTIEALRFIADSGRTPRFNVEFHLPTEEEIGGNGTLALVHDAKVNNRPLHGAVCLEPTSLYPYLGHRGCLTYELEIVGRAVHMGATETGLDAIAAAAETIAILQTLEEDLLGRASTSPYFAWHDRPCQVNVGKIHGGEWSGSVAETCLLTGDIGVVPPETLRTVADQVKAKVASVLEPRGFQLSWDFWTGLRNEAYVSDERVLFDGLRAVHAPETPRGWNVSCDARHYALELGVPTATFGAGALNAAHASDEYISVTEFQAGALRMARWLC